MFERIKALFGRRTAGRQLCYAGEYWPFDQARNSTTVTMRQVLDGSEPILLVSHDAEDHGWQFIGSSDANVEDGRVACLGCVVGRDPSVLEVADLPPGWEAVRDSPKHPWQRRESVPRDDD